MFKITAKGCHVLLTKNLWNDAGLTNGAVRTVKYLIYEKDLPPAQPKSVTGGSPITRIFETARKPRYRKFAL